MRLLPDQCLDPAPRGEARPPVLLMLPHPPREIVGQPDVERPVAPTRYLVDVSPPPMVAVEQNRGIALPKNQLEVSIGCR